MSNQYHEPIDKLDEQTKNCTRALMSLKEEIEAVDWYNQRVAATEDADLKEIMAHNRDEEIEHAVMALEWLRRNMGTKWDEELRNYLFTEGSVAHHEDGAQEEKAKKGLNIGNLK